MKVNIIKPFGIYKAGATEVTDARGKYLVKIGKAEESGFTGPVRVPRPKTTKATTEKVTKKADPKKDAPKKSATKKDK